MDSACLEQAIRHGLTLELLVPDINDRKCRLQIKRHDDARKFCAAVVFAHDDVVEYVSLDAGFAFTSVDEAIRFWLNILPIYLGVREEDHAVGMLKLLFATT